MADQMFRDTPFRYRFCDFVKKYVEQFMLQAGFEKSFDRKTFEKTGSPLIITII